MAADEIKRTLQKLRAIRMAQRSLAYKLDTIDWRIDVLEPELAETAKKIAADEELPIISAEDLFRLPPADKSKR